MAINLPIISEWNPKGIDKAIATTSRNLKPKVKKHRSPSRRLQSRRALLLQRWEAS
jgi:hypothetical protein